MGADEYGRAKRMLPASRIPLTSVMRSAGDHPAARIPSRSSARVPVNATLMGSAGIPSAVYERRGSGPGSGGRPTWRRQTAGITT